MSNQVVIFAKEFKTFNLDHDTYCSSIGKCECTEYEIKAMQKNSEGKSAAVKRKMKAPKVLTLFSGQRTTVPSAVLECQEVKFAINARTVRKLPA